MVSICSCKKEGVVFLREGRGLIPQYTLCLLKVNLGILKRGGGIKMQIWRCVERESLGFGNQVGMRKIDRNILRQKRW